MSEWLLVPVCAWTALLVGCTLPCLLCTQSEVFLGWSLQLSPSEQLGDLFKGAGDNATALACYQSTGATVKVVEGAVGLCFTRSTSMSRFSGAHVCCHGKISHAPWSCIRRTLYDMTKPHWCMQDTPHKATSRTWSHTAQPMATSQTTCTSCSA